MARAASRTRDFPDRPRLQPARRRLARRVRSAALLLAFAGCSGEAAAPRDDYRARFIESRWEDLERFDAAALVTGLREYIEGDDPEFGPDDPRFRALHEAVYRHKVDPVALRPLLGPHSESEVNARLRKRDKVAQRLLWSIMRRIARDGDPPAAQERLWDALARAAVHFAFDPVYGDAHTVCGEDLTEFCMDPEIRATEPSRAALLRHLEPLLVRWRARVTNKATSSLFGIVLRHVGAAGCDRLYGEWARMNDDERYDLLERTGDVDEPGRTARRGLVAALADPSAEIRGAAAKALDRLGAPVADFDPSDREEARNRALDGLRRWAETDS